MLSGSEGGRANTVRAAAGYNFSLLLRRWLEGLGGGQLHRAVQAAFATLPAVVAALPSGREFLRSPVKALGHLLSRTEDWLGALEARRARRDSRRTDTSSE